MQHSESLLTEILKLLQSLNGSVADFQVELKHLKDDVGTLERRFDDFLTQAMPGNLVETHAAQHAKLTRPSKLKQWLLERLKE